MPNLPISGLPAGSALSGPEPFPSVQSSTTVQVTATQIKTFTSNAPTFTGVAAFSAGAAALPSLIPTGDTNTGFWFPAADTIAASTSGQERLRINSSGNVGIGTSSPSSTLNVVSSAACRITLKGGNTAAQSSAVYFTAAGSADTLGAIGDQTAITGGTPDQVFAVFAGANASAFVPMAFIVGNNERMRITSAGNVGIGTTSPSAPLDINVATGYIRVNSTTNTNPAYIYLLNNGGNFFVGRENSGGTAFGTTAYSSVLYSAGAYPMVFFTDSSERMRITSAGNVGIGTTSPSAPLHVVASSNVNTLVLQYDNGTPGIKMMSNAASSCDIYAGTSATTGIGRLSYSTANDAWTIWTNTTERMRITSAGNVGIGVAPSAWSGLRGLQNGNASLSAASFDGYLSANVFYDGSGWKYINSAFGIQYFQDATTDGAHVWRTAASGSSGAAATLNERMRINNAGNVLIGRTAAPSGSPIGKVVMIGDTAIEGNTSFIAVSTTPVSLCRATQISGLYFVSGYNASGGAQGWWLLAALGSGSVVTTIASNNVSGLTVTFTLSGGILQAATASGTMNLQITSITYSA